MIFKGAPHKPGNIYKAKESVNTPNKNLKTPIVSVGASCGKRILPKRYIAIVRVIATQIAINTSRCKKFH